MTDQTHETHDQNDPLTRELTELTAPAMEESNLWRAALESSRAPSENGRERTRTLLHTRVPGIAVAAVILLTIGVGSWMIFGDPLDQTSRLFSFNEPPLSTDPAAPSSVIPRSIGDDNVFRRNRSQPVPPLRPRREDSGVIGGGGGGFALEGLPDSEYEPPPPPAPPDTPDGERHVVRQATIELLADDVRTTFLKAQRLVSEAGGEFVQDSALTGKEEHARANLTLRVRADRLSAVLNELRELGIVAAESQGGDDVTGQVVDIAARLRNEERVEQELLALFDTRQDSPLKEVLQLREEINRVRQRIEQLTGQRDRLSRLVSLASILVIITPPDVEEEDKVVEEAGIGTYFLDRIASAWGGSLRFLADTVSVLLSALVGGILWWALIAAGVIAYRRHRWRRESSLG